jgi:hypothetical protein
MVQGSCCTDRGLKAAAWYRARWWYADCGLGAAAWQGPLMAPTAA